MSSQDRLAASSSASTSKVTMNSPNDIDWDALAEFALQEKDMEFGSTPWQDTLYSAQFDALSPSSSHTDMYDSHSPFDRYDAFDPPLSSTASVTSLESADPPEWLRWDRLVSSLLASNRSGSSENGTLSSQTEGAHPFESSSDNASNEIDFASQHQHHWREFTGTIQDPFVPLPMHLPQAPSPPSVPTEPSLWSGPTDSTTPAASSHAAFTASPPFPPQSVATGDVLDPTTRPSPTLALRESLPPLPDAKQETSPLHEDHVLLEPTQPVAGPSTLPATRLHPQRTAKRRRHEDEQENEAVVWLPGPTNIAMKGKGKATAIVSPLIDAVESSEGHAADNTKAVLGSQAESAAVATLRRSKRRRVEAVSQLHTPSASALSDPVTSTSDVSGMTRSPSATPPPLLPPPPTPLPTPPQPTGPACMLLNKDGTRCHHALTMDNARDKAHANSHSRANVGDPGFRCTFPGCNKQYATKHSRNKHIMGHHWGLEFPCDVPGCTKVYGRADEVSRHKRLAHGA